MGIVVNQSIKNVIITCLGFGIGAINTLFLFTHFLDAAYYGLVSYLFSASNLIWPLIAFGTQNTLVKFFSSYSNTDQQNKFLSLMLVLPLMVSLILGITGSIFYSQILDYFSDENIIIQPFVWTIFVLALALTYFEVFFAWSKVKLKSVFGNFMKELFLRVCIMMMLLLVYFKILSVDQFIYGLVIVYLTRLFIMMIYSLRLHMFNFKLSLPDNYIPVLKYSALILVAGSVATLLIDLDRVMIEQFLPIENVAKYGICAYIASVIIIPSRAMHQITYPLTAKLLNEKSFDQLKILYKKSSINLLATSGMLFALIICNVNQLFEFIPDEYELFMWVVLLISIGKLFDNLMGNNNAILFSSDYYRIVLKIGVIMVILALVLNFIFIPTLGLTGAAIATFGALFFYNSVKFWVVYKKFGMHPFSSKTLVVIGMIIFLTLGFYFWELSFHPILNIALKSVLITISYVIVLFKLNVSSDINDIIKNMLNRFG